jgi:hypothetical protein
VIGNNAGVLKQAYALERIRREARLKHYKFREKRLPNNTIQIVLTA